MSDVPEISAEYSILMGHIRALYGPDLADMNTEEKLWVALTLINQVDTDTLAEDLERFEEIPAKYNDDGVLIKAAVTVESIIAKAQAPQMALGSVLYAAILNIVPPEDDEST
jgi:hypothetical protein